ncbi:MAG: mechanosensitive ion channel family protein, partial [Micrococcales bacterium]|nr:mechanosensitive ion channel family protein [Micrococcales bacterium]
LSELGVKLTPLLTSAGVSGIIVGLGAQSLIRDLIAGLFLVVEGQYGVGDTIDTGEVSGVVQEIGTRVTRLQSADGEIWYVRNGEISTLGNRSQGWVTSDVDITVPSGRDPDEVMAKLQQLAVDLDADPQWHGRLLRPPQVIGLTSFDTKQMVFTIKVSSPQRTPVEQEIRARALAALAE